MKKSGPLSFAAVIVAVLLFLVGAQPAQAAFCSLPPCAPTVPEPEPEPEVDPPRPSETVTNVEEGQTLQAGGKSVHVDLTRGNCDVSLTSERGDAASVDLEGCKGTLMQISIPLPGGKSIDACYFVQTSASGIQMTFDALQGNDGNAFWYLDNLSNGTYHYELMCDLTGD